MDINKMLKQKALFPAAKQVLFHHNYHLASLQAAFFLMIDMICIE
jgi:hypothetical protein